MACLLRETEDTAERWPKHEAMGDCPTVSAITTETDCRFFTLVDIGHYSAAPAARAKVTSNSRVRNELDAARRSADNQKSFSSDLIAVARALADTARF